jgi:hypothetical protein
MKQSSYIDTAMLPMAMTNPTANQNCDICGWGNMEYPNFKPAEKLQCVELPPIPNQTCNKSYRGAIHDDIMCIGLMAGGKDSCQVTRLSPEQISARPTKLCQITLVFWL